MPPGLHQPGNSVILPTDAAGETKKTTLNNHIIMRTQKQTAGGPRFGLILLVAFIAVPLLEIALFIEVGGWIGLGPTLALIVVSAVIGAWIMRQQGIGVLRRAQQQLAAGVLPVMEVFEGLCLLVAGALLLTPGFFTDALGALLLVPAARRALYRRLRHRIEAHVVDASGPRQHGARGRPGPTIEAEYEEIEDPGPAERRQQDMPPARGDWGRPP
jgi:UPF0716 protein FxsA